MRNRKPIRLKHFDYSAPGFYFITICVKNRHHAFGRVENGVMILSRAGQIADECWKNLPVHYPHCRLDEFAVMPNHFHGIVEILNNVGDGDGVNVVGDGLKPSPTATKRFHGLTEIVRGFKTFSSRRINENQNGDRFQWQRSYHDRVVRNAAELNRIRKYIILNPLNWQNDIEFGGDQSGYRSIMEYYSAIVSG